MTTNRREIFNKSYYANACRRYHELWEKSDKVLYNLCRKFPGHDDRAGTNAKIWVIGRAYATGIERQIRSDGTQSSAMEQLTKHFWKNRSAVDQIFKSLKRVREPLSKDKLKVIAKAHCRLLRVIKKATRKSPRSFVSKYLHFHNSAVPIYDSVANSRLRRFVLAKGCKRIIISEKNTDQEYVGFLERFWWLYQQTPRPRKTGCVKLLDIYLLELARNTRPQKAD
ncbi:MAG TPA: hypothetical protein VGO67_07355 [Verrucomicrobiae bacterium]|jgi:hypothetical protein